MLSTNVGRLASILPLDSLGYKVSAPTAIAVGADTFVPLA